MSKPNPSHPDDARLREHLARSQPRGRPIGHKTARELAAWFAESVGPGFATFLSTGVVTGHFYTELARLYDLRQPEVEQWLDNLTRFVLAQPVDAPRRAPKRPEDQR